MDEFTNEEMERINALYGSDFADATPDDFKLIKRWEAAIAKMEAEHDAQNAILRAEMKKRLDGFIEQTEHAMNALDELKEAALARLKAVE